MSQKAGQKTAIIVGMYQITVIPIILERSKTNRFLLQVLVLAELQQRLGLQRPGSRSPSLKKTISLVGDAL